MSEILITSLTAVVALFFEDGERTPAKGHIKGYITCKNVGRYISDKFIEYLYIIVFYSYDQVGG